MIRPTGLLALVCLTVLFWLAACRAATGGLEPAAGSAPDGAAPDRAAPDGAANVPPAPTPLPDLGPAPDFANEVWLNSEPLDLATLQGKVVLLEFWTFGCINCQRVMPYLNQWYDRYAGEQFEIVGVHYPEFTYERKLANVADALERFEITYPVAIDNEGVTWRAYQQRYWPTRYLIDKNGRLRYKHIGEGAYDETAAHIEALLAEP